MAGVTGAAAAEIANMTRNGLYLRLSLIWLTVVAVAVVTAVLVEYL
jgi:hypothetical protein